MGICVRLFSECLVEWNWVAYELDPTRCMDG